MKKYYLYRQPILKNTANKRGDWYFDDEFETYEEAFKQAKINAEKNSWKVWKIEEVYDFT